MPFLCAKHGGGEVIAAIGWSGSWVAQIDRDTEKTTRIQAGISAEHTESTRFVLRPGGQVRMPRMLLLFW